MAYTNLCEVRDAGISEDIAADFKINMLIDLWCKFIDKYCDRWFESRALDIKTDGNDSKYLHLNIPIITLSSLYINESISPASNTDYIVYNNRNQFRDDRNNPKIVYNNGIFKAGSQNQRLVGTFGYVEEDGATPKAIRYAALKLVIEKIMNPIILTPEFESLTVSLNTQSGTITEEITDEHSQKYKTIQVKPRMQGISGVIKDFEVLDILNTYRNSFQIQNVG
jgi:hypothetical protein